MIFVTFKNMQSVIALFSVFVKVPNSVIIKTRHSATSLRSAYDEWVLKLKKKYIIFS